MAEPPELDSPEAFLELARKVSLAPELLDALGPLGYRTIADFGYSLPTLDTLNGLLEIIPQEVWDSLHAPQPALHPATGRLRRLLERCHQAITMHSPTALHAQKPPEPAAPAQPALNTWAEHAPPRLSNAAVQSMRDTFACNYPGELLDQDSMPSLRLLSIVHQWFKPEGAIKWVPWQLRLSQRQYQEILEARTTRMLRTEAQLVSAALLDETPEIPISSMHLTPAWLARTQAVFRNAIALCGGAHLASLKNFDKKIFDYATASTPADTGLRNVNLHELLHADRKLWNEIASLHSQGWTLDNALHELTHVRSDIHGLLQQRARPPKDPGKGKDKGRGGKGRGDAPKGPRRDTKQAARESRATPSTPAAQLADPLPALQQGHLHRPQLQVHARLRFQVAQRPGLRQEAPSLHACRGSAPTRAACLLKQSRTAIGALARAGLLPYRGSFLACKPTAAACKAARSRA